MKRFLSAILMAIAAAPAHAAVYTIAEGQFCLFAGAGTGKKALQCAATFEELNKLIPTAKAATFTVKTTITVAPDPFPAMPPGIPFNPALIPAANPGGNFAEERISPTDEQPVESDIGSFRTTCDFSHMATDDPIVYPGQPGKSHLHAFFGNTGTNANSTAASIANTGNSTCRGGTANRTGYWQPAMIDTKDGTPIQPLSLQAYYKTGYNGVRPEDVKPFPDGLRMISGNPMATTPNTAVGSFNCDLDDGTNSGGVGSIPTNCKSETGLLVNVNFPQCWDGKNLDSPDHKSHMAFSNNAFVTAAQLAGKPIEWWQTLTTTQGCPPTHPVALAAISLGVWYQIPKDPSEAKRWRLASDMYEGPAGYSLHADWFNGWETAVMKAFSTNCLAAKKDCHSHLLGDGRQIY